MKSIDLLRESTLKIVFNYFREDAESFDDISHKRLFARECFSYF